MADRTLAYLTAQMIFMVTLECQREARLLMLRYQRFFFFFFSDDPWYTTLNVLGVEKLRRIFFSPVGYAKWCLYCKGISVQRGPIYSPMVNFINFC